MSGSPEEATTITLRDGNRAFRSKTLILSMTTHVAPYWFSDGLFEADPATDGDQQARRREILFSACCAESYLVEWARDMLQAKKVQHHVLYEKLQSYFPGPPRRPAPEDAWQNVPRQLYEDGCIPKRPGRFSARQRKDFQRLIVLRNDITHATLSHPYLMGPEGNQPSRARTTVPDLVQMPPGWAIRVIAERIQELHANTGTEVPEWARISTERPQLT